MSYLIFSTSLNPNSRSRILAKKLDTYLSATHPTELMDLREWPLPFCDGGQAYGDANVKALNEKIAGCAGILLCTPVYNFTINAVAKNLIELTGRSWTDKVVGFACSAGGSGSYMSIMPTANSLMLDFRCVIAPRFVYATEDKFTDDKTDVSDPDVEKRLNELAERVTQLGHALSPSQ